MTGDCWPRPKRDRPISVQRLKKVGTTTAPLRVSHLDGESVLIHGLLMLVADSFTASLPIRKSGLNFASLQPWLFSASRITALIPCWRLSSVRAEEKEKKIPRLLLFCAKSHREN